MSYAIAVSPPLGLANRHLSGLIMVMAAAALWATVGVASRLIPNDLSLPEEAYGFARTAVAGPALLALAILGRGRTKVSLRAESLPGFLVFGICCALFQIGLFRSFSLLGVTITVFLTVCLPPVIAVVWTLLRRPAYLSRNVFTALLMAVGGLLAFSSSGLSGGGMPQVATGLVLSVMASLAFVLMSHTARQLAADHPPLLVAGLGLTVTSCILAGAVFAVSPHGWTALAKALGHWNTGVFLLYLGLFPTALAYLLYCAGMARCRTAACGLVASMIEPAVAAGLAVALLGEVLSRWELLGCLLLFAAMVVLWRDEQRSKALNSPAFANP